MLWKGTRRAHVHNDLLTPPNTTTIQLLEWRAVENARVCSDSQLQREWEQHAMRLGCAAVSLFMRLMVIVIV